MNTHPRTSRQPKLRSSCDGCGSAKLKCDRGQPECGRCASLGITCVYGVSRKMGKPPRERLQMPATPGQSRTPRDQARNSKDSRPASKGHSRCTSGSISDTMLSRSRSSSGVNDIPSTWGTVDDYPNNVVLDPFHNDPLGPSLTNFTSLDPGEWILADNIGEDLSSTNMDTEAFPALWTEFESSPDSTAQTTASHALLDDRGYLDSPFLVHDDGKLHDCSREAHEILSSLSISNLSKVYSANTSAAGPTSGSPNRAPLDFILHLNREASERLNRLLNCSCASHSHLAFLYASIISRVLLWYHQETGCSKLSPRSPSSEMALRPGMSPPASLFGSVCRSPPSWLGTAATSTTNTSVSGTNTPSSTVTRVCDLAPTQMSMGCFNIDDQQMQVALRIQLLLGEMKRIACLIEAFTSRGSGGTDDASPGNVDALYKSLGSWLMGEHARIVETMRSRLKEVSIYYMGV